MPSWDETKRRRNIRLHHLDFADAEVARKGSELHIISLRKAERYEARYYFETVRAELGEG